MAHEGQPHPGNFGKGADIRFCLLPPPSKLKIRMRRHTEAYDKSVTLRISAEENMGPGGCCAHSNSGRIQTY